MTKGSESGVGKRSAHAPPSRGSHSGGPEEGGAACETHDGGLELVVGVVTEGEDGYACAGDCVEEEVVAGIAGGAFYGAGGGHGGEWGDPPGDVCDVVGDAEEAGVLGCGRGHVVGGGLEAVHDMDGEEGGGGEELAEEEEEAGRVRAGGVGDGDGELRGTAPEGTGELADVDRGQHTTLPR